MEISILKQQIKNNQLDDFYVFGGDEWAIQRMYIDKIASTRHLEIKYIDSINDIYRTLVNSSFIKRNYCYVVRDDKDILSNEKLQKQLLGGILKQNILILVLTQINKRLKGFKNLEDKYISFDKMPVETLKKYVKREISLSDSNCDRLINICECDYGRILLEINKIKIVGPLTFTEVGNDANYDADATFKMLVEDGTIYVPPEDAVFDLVDAILKRKPVLAYELFQDCKDIGEANLVILSNLYNATKQLLQVQSCDSDDIMETCGITYPQMKAAESRKNKYSVGELVNAMHMIRNIEKGIKIGEIEDSLSVEYVLINLF